MAMVCTGHVLVMYPMNLHVAVVVYMVGEHQHLIVGQDSPCKGFLHVACTGHVTHEKNAVAVHACGM